MTGLLDLAPVIPVVTVEHPAHAVSVARALLAGGIGIIELTLRTARAVEALAAVSAQVPEIRLGAGSILTLEQADAAVENGAQFLVSPGTSPRLLTHLASMKMPVLPGVATVSEILTALDHGVTDLKFFPAGPAGGPTYLAAIAGPVPQVRFCPTGGVTLANMAEYLALPNVPSVGGGWLTPATALATGDWAAVSRHATKAQSVARRITSDAAR